MSKLTVRLIVLVILGLTLSVASATMVHIQPQASPWLVAILELLERLGDALAIAAIVGGVIEQLVFKKELLDRARDFFIRYFGRLLPEELQGRLRDYLEISLIRNTWNIVYDIEHWPNKSGYLKLTTKMNYKMENRSEEAQTYKFRYEVENSLCPEVGETRITYLRLHDVEYDEDALKEQNFVRTERGYQVVRETEVSIPPYRRVGHSVHEFEAWSVECFKKSIVSPFWALHPVIRATFKILHPADVDVFFDVTFGDVKEMPEPKKSTEGDKAASLWTITKPILPGQGFEVRCKLKQGSKSLGTAAP